MGVFVSLFGLAACVSDASPAPPSEGAGGAANTGGGGSAAGGSAAGGSAAGGSGGGAITGGGGEGAGTPDGTWRNPFPITALPFSASGDTTLGVTAADHYAPCAPEIDEGGPEIVYRVDIDDVGWLWARLDDVDGDDVDVDVMLLHEADVDTCVTRGHIEFGTPVRPGTYYLVVDSWVDGGGTALSGPYLLDVGMVTDAGDDCYVSPIDCDNTRIPYVNGTPTEAPGDAGCPDGMAQVDDFCIDRFEAMLVEVVPGPSAGDPETLVPWSPYATPGDADVMALSVAGVRPQGFITQVQAEAACMRAGKRLCTDNEWLRACQGSSGNTYPYGDTLQPGVCNDARDCHPVVQTFETDASWVWSQLDDACIPQLPEGLELTGSYMGCSTSEGVFDMMGNLHEWTADPAGTFRGGFYMDTAINGPGCHYRTTAHSIHHWDYSTGFRCCF